MPRGWRATSEIYGYAHVVSVAVLTDWIAFVPPSSIATIWGCETQLGLDLLGVYIHKIRNVGSSSLDMTE